MTGLLEEMRGLGILVGGTAHGYRLRSPNVLRLLGGEKDVERELEKFRERPYEPQPDSTVIRRPLPAGEAPASPLSLDQEGRILSRERGVDVILGSPALGLEDVRPALDDLIMQRAAEEQFKSQIVAGKNAGDLVAKAQRAYQSSAAVGLWLHLDLSRLSLGDRYEALQQLAAWVGNLSHESRFVRMVATLGPDAIVEGHASGALSRLERQGAVNLYRLHRWKEQGLRQWLHDVEFKPESHDQQPAQLISETAGWPILLRPTLQERRGSKKRQRTPETGHAADASLLEAAGLLPRSTARRLFRVVADLGDAVDVPADLAVFLADAGVNGDCTPLINAMLDLDVLIGSRERVRAEPLLARLALSLPA
jgi:hypothetical protein